MSLVCAVILPVGSLIGFGLCALFTVYMIQTTQ